MIKNTKGLVLPFGLFTKPKKKSKNDVDLWKLFERFVQIYQMSPGDPCCNSNITANTVGTGIAAAGTTLGTGTALTKQFNVVATATGSSAECVVLPVGNPYTVIYVKNASSATIKVFPHTSAGVINGGSAGAAVTIAAGKTGILICTSSEVWSEFSFS